MYRVLFCGCFVGCVPSSRRPVIPKRSQATSKRLLGFHCGGGGEEEGGGGGWSPMSSLPYCCAVPIISKLFFFYKLLHKAAWMNKTHTCAKEASGGASQLQFVRLANPGKRRFHLL